MCIRDRIEPDDPDRRRAEGIGGKNRPVTVGEPTEVVDMGQGLSLIHIFKEYQGSIKVTNLKPHIAKIFTITGLDKTFSITTQG